MFTKVLVKIEHSDGLLLIGVLTALKWWVLTGPQAISTCACRNIEFVQKIIKAILYLWVRANVPLPVSVHVRVCHMFQYVCVRICLCKWHWTNSPLKPGVGTQGHRKAWGRRYTLIHTHIKHDCPLTPSLGYCVIKNEGRGKERELQEGTLWFMIQ